MALWRDGLGRAWDFRGLQTHSRAKNFGDEDGFPLETGGNDKRGDRRPAATSSACPAADGVAGMMALWRDGLGRAWDFRGLQTHSRAKNYGDEDGFPLTAGGHDKRGDGAVTGWVSGVCVGILMASGVHGVGVAAGGRGGRNDGVWAGWIHRVRDFRGLQTHSRAKNFGDGDGFPIKDVGNDRG